MKKNYEEPIVEVVEIENIITVSDDTTSFIELPE